MLRLENKNLALNYYGDSVRRQSVELAKLLEELVNVEACSNKAGEQENDEPQGPRSILFVQQPAEIGRDSDQPGDRERKARRR